MRQDKEPPLHALVRPRVGLRVLINILRPAVKLTEHGVDEAFALSNVRFGQTVLFEFRLAALIPLCEICAMGIDQAIQDYVIVVLERV